jgi:hypothetical protein
LANASFFLWIMIKKIILLGNKWTTFNDTGASLLVFMTLERYWTYLTLRTADHISGTVLEGSEWFRCFQNIKITSEVALRHHTLQTTDSDPA